MDFRMLMLKEEFEFGWDDLDDEEIDHSIF